MTLDPDLVLPSYEAPERVLLLHYGFANPTLAPLGAGRWSRPNHVTLGEGRAAIKLLAALSRAPGAHGNRVGNLEDNEGLLAASARYIACVVSACCSGRRCFSKPYSRVDVNRQTR